MGSLFAVDIRASPAYGDDDAGAAADATAAASAGSAAAAVDAVAVDDMCMDIGIGTAATGIGTDIGDWTGVFGVVLPGPAVPYRWDDMYHQKPGLAVCLYVVFNHSFVIRIVHNSLRPARQSKTLVSSSRLPPLRLNPPYGFYGSRAVFSRTEFSAGFIAARSNAQRK